MAIVKEDEESRSKERPVGGGTSYLGGGYVGGGSSASPSYSRSGGGGGRFTNLSSYLQGGESQGAELGANVAGQVEASGNQATADINTFGENAQNQIAAGTPSLNKQDLKNYLAQTAPDQNLINTYASGEIPKVAASAPPAAVAYSGPSEMSQMTGYGQAQKSTQDTQEKVGEKGIGSFEGTQTMLSGGKGANYTKPMGMYDTMFARTGGKGNIDAAQKKWGNIGDVLSGKEAAVTEGVGYAKNEATKVNQAWGDAYNQAQRQAADTNQKYQKLQEDTATQKQKDADVAAQKKENEDRLANQRQQQQIVAQNKANADLQSRQAWLDANLKKQGNEYLQKGGRDRSLIGDMLGEQKYKWQGRDNTPADSPMWWNEQTIQNYLATGKMPWENTQGYII